MKVASFVTTPEDRDLIAKIAKRASRVAKDADIEYTIRDAGMDITACHVNGCRLDLNKLLNADSVSFSHDVFGIRKHLNRTTGQIPKGKFDPRCHAPAAPKPLACPACKELISTVKIVTRNVARVTDGKIYLPRASQIEPNDIDDEGIECPECGDLIRTPLEIVPANPQGEFTSWVEAAANIPAGRHWRPKIKLDTETGNKNAWLWCDDGDNFHKWSRPFDTKELAAKDACEQNGFLPTIIQ